MYNFELQQTGIEFHSEMSQFVLSLRRNSPSYCRTQDIAKSKQFWRLHSIDGVNE